MQNFPYKILIIAVAILLGLLMFREPIANLIFQTEEVTILDKVTIKVDKDESAALELAQQEYETKIAELTKDINMQKDQIISLQAETKDLLTAIANCGQAKAEAQILQEKVDKIEHTGDQLQEKSAVLNKTPVLSRKKN